MSFKVKFHVQFVPEWRQLGMALKERVGDILDHLEDEGPFLGRPEVDTLNGSKHANMRRFGQSLAEKFGALRLPSIQFSAL
jgi:hypothetical protein